MEGIGLIKGTISGQATILDGWDGWESDATDEKNTMDEELIQKRSIQSYQRRTEDSKNNIGATGATGTAGTTEEDNDSNSTTSKDGALNEDDGFILEEGEIVEDKGGNTETAVASNLGAIGVTV